MHLLATDRLICPRCGPDFGLILVSKRLEARRIHEGFFGCPNCREEYPIRGGYGDLRPSPRKEEEGDILLPADNQEMALQIAALLGVREGPGFLLLSGSSAAFGEQVAAMIEEVEVIALHPGLRSAAEVSGVSRMAAGPILPFRSRTLRGAVVEGESGRTGLPEAARTLAIGARLVLTAPPPGATEEIRQLGFDLLMEDEATLVGVLRRG